MKFKEDVEIISVLKTKYTIPQTIKTQLRFKKKKKKAENPTTLISCFIAP